jgi:hypothetical protein
MSAVESNDWLNADDKSMEHAIAEEAHLPADWVSRKASLQHLFNPLHLYCRLVDLRISRTAALKILRPYEFLWKRVGLR